MSIKREDLIEEKSRLKDINKWIDKEILISEEKRLKAEEKVVALKKATRGYNVELEIAKQLLNNANANCTRFNESKKQPYFARVDFKESIKDIEELYIGKFGLFDNEKEEEKVIDWRAPIADLYYSGTQGKVVYHAPIGKISGELLLKRRFLIKNSEIIDAFDEGINDIILRSGEDIQGNSLIDEFLKFTLEEGASRKLKDVVATIQKEQNQIIRWDINKPILVQGSAGTGKTTVALHRLAYLIYRYKETIEGKDILVIAPNKLFLDYISEILPSLGTEEVSQTTFEDLALKFLNLKTKVFSKDEKLCLALENESSNDKLLMLNSSKLKGSITYKILMDRYIKYLEKVHSNVSSIIFNNYTLFQRKDLRKLFLQDLSYLPINKRKEEIKRYVLGKIKEKVRHVEDIIELEYLDKANKIKREMKDSADRRNLMIKLYEERDKEKEELQVNIKKCIKEYFNNWKNEDIINTYYNIFMDRNIFDSLTEGKIPKELSDYMVLEAEKNLNKKILDADDLPAMMYLKSKIYGHEYTFKHIVVDEVQDYSLFQLEIIKDLTTNNSMTIVGDLGQGIYYYKGISDWGKVMKNIFNSDVKYTEMTQSYRSTIEIINFANSVLNKQKVNLKPAAPVIRHGEKPKILKLQDDIQFVNEINDILVKMNNMNKNRIAIIGKDSIECQHIANILENSKNNWRLIKGNEDVLDFDRIIIPSYMSKGLEFDCTVIYNCNNENYKNTEMDKKLLYVALTRALHFVYIYYKGEISNIID